MKSEEINHSPYYHTVRNKDYKLCLKTEPGKGNIFFILSEATLPEGSKQVSLPTNYEVDTNRGFPVLRKK